MAITQQQVQEAIAVLRDGGCVVFPTETAYGIAADATNEAAVDRIADIKQRPDEASFAVIVDSPEMAEQYGNLGEKERGFAKKHWPGPLTIVLQEAAETLAKRCRGRGTVGVRVSSHPVAHALVEGLGKPIVATSANVHGLETPYTVETARAQFQEAGLEPDLYLDEGELPQRAPSMIIEVVNGELVVHRQGSFKL